jgi:hypothetical protein
MRRSCASFSGAVVFLLSASTLLADFTIPEPKNANQADGIGLVISNYTWDATIQILVCDPFVTCNRDTREFSDRIEMVNKDGKAQVLFSSDSDQGSLRALQMPNDVFESEGPFNAKISLAFDAHDNTGKAARLTVIFSSDPDTPSVKESDTINVLAGAGSPEPKISKIPEPTLILPADLALMMLVVKIVRRSGSIRSKT